MKMTSLPKFLFAVLMTLVVSSARAEIVVVVGVSSPIAQLSREEVINIFMGRYRLLPAGAAVVPVEPGADTASRRSFYASLLGKSVADIRAYWARLVFSGRTSPPDEVPNDGDVVARVAKDPLALGYVDRQAVTSRVRVVYVLNP